jgi:molecular chaperone DnaJ
MNIDKDYYNIFGLTKNAKPEEIKKTYKKLALLYHPDRTKGNKEKETKFKNISEAYSIIGNGKKKKSYDTQSRYGKFYKTYNSNPFSNFNQQKSNFNSFNDFDYKNFYNSYHTQQKTKNHNEHLDITINVIITLKNVYINKPIEINYKKYQNCVDCNGTGINKNGIYKMCGNCNGLGIDIFGKICKYCQGLGKIYLETCKTCNGEKILLKKNKFNLNNIYKIKKSKNIILKKYGHQSKFILNKKGDLKLNIIYQNVENYIIENEKLIYNLNLHYQDAIDGIKYDFVNLDGKKIKITIPKKTSNGNMLKLTGKGLLYNNNERGDLYIKINIIINYEKIMEKL